MAKAFSKKTEKSKDTPLALGLLILNLSCQPWVPLSYVPYFNFGCLICTLFTWIQKQPLTFQFGLIVCFTNFYVFCFYPIWPLPLLLSIGVIRGGYALTHDPRFSYQWFKWGTVQKSHLRLSFLFTFVSSAFLFLWLVLFKPDLSDLKANYVPSWSLFPLILWGTVFSLANAFAEEFLFRAVLFQALSKHLKSVPLILLIQAVPFACLHLHGFPRGLAGVALAFIYGLMMGSLRHLSKGFLLAWIVHVFVDLTVVTLLFSYSD